ncbi:hypothetical protein evm_000892 [Chilo suppressalis]|nr:hypothetical protein evm_000892 [Chilo suppressalis]
MMPSLLPVSLLGIFLSSVQGKWIEGRINTKEDWAFLARFCFLSIDGQFEYLIEYDKNMGTPNLLLYYDDEKQWPAVYHSRMSCKEREAVLNKAGQNQIIKLSHWYPDTEYSGCVLTQANKELPASKSTSTTLKPTTIHSVVPVKNSTNNTKIQPPVDPNYYNKFLKTTTTKPKSTTANVNSTTWYELLPTGDLNFTTITPDDDVDLWESIGPERNDTQFGNLNLKDVEILFENHVNGTNKIKRSTSELYERFRRRRLNSASASHASKSDNTERMLVICHNSRRFRSARERWWFIAISNCDSTKGLDVKYKFLMTNGPEGDFWHEHFSADEFYVLPVLLAYTFAYVIVMVAAVMCSVELRSRHLLHATYKLFLISGLAQQAGAMLQALAYIKYASSGVRPQGLNTTGQFLCSVAETTFLLLLILMAKGYTITRGRLKVGFTVKLTIFMCCYIVTYMILFIYQAKEFDPGEVLYLYESPAGYGLIVLRVLAWCVFAYSTFFTVKKYPEKNAFYCPFSICGTLWFYAGPLFILTANSYIDKWVRESVVIAVLMFITFSGHIMFLLLTLPVFANKNFPYHVRTTQVGVMEVTGSSALDGFGPNPYHPSNGAAQTVIIPLTRRTEELIGNMYSQYMASAPPLSLENGTPKLNGVPKSIDSISPQNGIYKQDSTETNVSDDIKPILNDKDAGIFTVESQMSKIETVLPVPVEKTVLPHENNSPKNGELSRGDLPNVLRSRRTILEPIKDPPVPNWSLAKGPCVVAMQKKIVSVDEDTEPKMCLPNGKKVPPVRNGLQPRAGEISTIHEGRIQTYSRTADLFNASSGNG